MVHVFLSLEVHYLERSTLDVNSDSLCITLQLLLGYYFNKVSKLFTYILIPFIFQESLENAQETVLFTESMIKELEGKLLDEREKKQNITHELEVCLWLRKVQF